MMTEAQARQMTMDQVRAWILHHEQMGAAFSKILQQLVGQPPPSFGGCSDGSCSADPSFGATRVSGGGFRGGRGFRGGGGFRGGVARIGGFGGGFRRFGGGWGGWGWPWWSGYNWYPYYPLYGYNQCGTATAQSLLQASASSRLPIDAVAQALGLPLWCPAVVQAKQIVGA